jgi:hypothetical protein
MQNDSGQFTHNCGSIGFDFNKKHADIGFDFRIERSLKYAKPNGFGNFNDLARGIPLPCFRASRIWRACVACVISKRTTLPSHP